MKCIIQLAYNSVHFIAPEQYIIEVSKKEVINAPSGNFWLRHYFRHCFNPQRAIFVEFLKWPNKRFMKNTLL